jgi:hypothetical protein
VFLLLLDGPSLLPPPPTSSVTVPFISGQSFSVNPTSVLFGNQMVNTTSAPRAVTVTNTGNMPQPVRGRMNARQVKWQDFAHTNDCPSMLAVGASCTFNITFRPVLQVAGSPANVDGLNDEEGYSTWEAQERTRGHRRQYGATPPAGSGPTQLIRVVSLLLKRLRSVLSAVRYLNNSVVCAPSHQ